MAWTNNPYCTLQDVKEAIDPDMSTDDDNFLGKQIIQAQKAIDQHVGYRFQTDGPGTIRLFDGQDLQYLLVDPYITVTKVEELQRFSTTVNNVWTNTITNTIDITGDIVMRPNNTSPQYYFTRFSGLGFEEGTQNYRVTGTWGWPTEPDQIYPGVPSDITRACIRLVVHYYRMRDTAYATATQQQGGVTMHYTKTMPEDVVEILQKYRKNMFPLPW